MILDDKGNTMVLEGSLLVERAFEAGLVPHEVWGTQIALTPLREKFANLDNNLCKFTAMSTADLSALAGFQFHRGVLGFAQKPKMSGTLDLTNSNVDKNILLIPHLSDPANLGSLARSAYAFGFNRLVLGPNCPDPYTRRVLRASMAAVLRLRPLRIEASSVENFLLQLSDEYTVLAADSDPQSLDITRWKSQTKWPNTVKNLALILGHEHKGLENVQLPPSATKIHIPMSSGHDSLNVSIAGAILMYALTRTSPNESTKDN